MIIGKTISSMYFSASQPPSGVELLCQGIQGQTFFGDILVFGKKSEFGNQVRV